jgi:hypothetical protein
VSNNNLAEENKDEVAKLSSQKLNDLIGIITETLIQSVGIQEQEIDGIIN